MGGSPASDHAFRSQLVKKNLKFQVLLLYALHEIESAVGKYKAAADPASATSQASIQKALDEWWVFYAGSLETGTASGYGTYILAEKRSSFFGTDGEKVGNGGKSRVNKILLAGTKQLQTLFKTAGNGPEIDGIVQCMRAQLKVPVIQGCIMYAYKSDTSSAFPGTNSAAARGELMSFCTRWTPRQLRSSARRSMSKPKRMPILPSLRSRAPFLQQISTKWAFRVPTSAALLMEALQRRQRQPRAVTLRSVRTAASATPMLIRTSALGPG